ncbi:MAG: hypothetical protein ACK5N8_02190 [Alphaproteobacteria bacterium]
MPNNENTLTKTITEGIADALSLVGIPTGAMSEIYKAYQQEKIEKARDILLDEVKEGDFSSIGADERLSIIHRFMLSSINGNAKINLRLLAKLINSLLNGGKLEKGLYSSQFSRYAQILETLSYEEIQTLALLYKLKKDSEKEKIGGFQTFAKQEMRDPSPYYVKARETYSDINEFNALIYGLQRTGFIIPNQKQHVGIYQLSPVFDKIINLVDFQDALNKEKAGN